MEVLPAIDLRDGKVVRLAQGDYDRQTIYSSSPVEIAQAFADAGCRWLHMVDLDAALLGVASNLHAVAQVARSVDILVELGGGIRNDLALGRALETGVDRVVIGSAALEDWPWFESLLARPELNGKIALGLDAKNGRLAKHGWTEQVDLTAVEVARRVKGSSLAAIIYTDISRDGMLTGPNFEATREVIDATDIGVIASGGMSSVEDIARCRQIGCAGAIVGRAYYEGRIDLAQAMQTAQG